MNDALSVAEIGSYYVGGRAVTVTGLPDRPTHYSAGVQNGDLAVEAMYVQYVRLSRPRGMVPLMLWHGGGLCGSMFETKPDGAPGWQNYFLRAGWDVYVSDAVERGRAGWARFPQIWSPDPVFRPNRESWELFRIGPAGSYDPDPKKRRVFSGVQFPHEAFDEYAKFSVPRWTSNDAPTLAAYEAYLQRQGPAVIIAHSQGIQFACQAALHLPDKVKAVVMMEGNPRTSLDGVDPRVLANVPHLFVFGDNIEQHEHWIESRDAARAYEERIRSAGCPTDFYELPKMGIHGNTHMAMMDRNSDQVAELIQSWLTSKGLTRK